MLYITTLILAKKRLLQKRFVWTMIVMGTILITFSYNAFSYDIFNYIFDAKIVTHYFSNPYIHKALDYPNDPMLSFMRWTHRAYPYGPVWLAMTIPLSFLGFQFFLPTFFLFKILAATSYIGTIYYIGKIAQRINPKNELVSIVFFALNPLIIIECLVSGHLDIVMMVFCMMAFYFLLLKKTVQSYTLLALSIGIKFVTGALLPLFILMQITHNQSKKRTELWLALCFIFLIVGVIAEIYHGKSYQSWYLLVPLTFASLLSDKYYISIPSIIISVGSSLIYMPFLFFGNWDAPVQHLMSQILIISYGIALFTTLFHFINRTISHLQIQKLGSKK
jgi:hypothetical protein